MKKRDICFIDFPGHNTNNNAFFNNKIYQKVLKMSSFFVYINSGKSFKENSNKMILSSIYKEVIHIHEGDITSKLFIDLCLFIFNKVDLLDEKERDLEDINKEIKETLEIKGDDYIINCSFFSSELYKDYLSKIEEYKLNKIIDLFKKYFNDFKSQEKDELFDEKEEESYIKFIEDKLINKINSEYQFEEIDLKKINKEEIISSDIYKEINTFLDKIYEENKLNKEEGDNYYDKLENISKYLIFCNKENKKLNLYKQSYASDTLEIMVDKIVKSHLLKETVYFYHLERLLRFLNIFFGMEKGFNPNEKNNLDELIQISLNNVDKYFEEFNGKEIIENYQIIILDFIKNQKTSFKQLMKKNSKDINKIIESLEYKVNEEMSNFKNLLKKALNKLEKNIGNELNKIGTEMILIDKDVPVSLSAKEKLIGSIFFCTFGAGAVAYGLFYAIPSMIINAISEERKFQQFLEEIEENIKNEFQNIKDSIENNIKSYKKIVTKKIKRFYGIFQSSNIKNDENWKDAKEIYQIIYNNYKSIKK